MNSLIFPDAPKPTFCGGKHYPIRKILPFLSANAPESAVPASANPIVITNMPFAKLEFGAQKLDRSYPFANTPPVTLLKFERPHGIYDARARVTDRKHSDSVRQIVMFPSLNRSQE